MSDDLEFSIRSRLKWVRDGADWVLMSGRRRMGRVAPASQGMWRSVKSGGRFSDVAGLSWAKDAVMAAATRELEWSASRKAA
jgi:hypothetical protein